MGDFVTGNAAVAHGGEGIAGRGGGKGLSAAVGLTMGEGWFGEETVFGREQARSMGGKEREWFPNPLPLFKILGLTPLEEVHTVDC